MFQPKEFRLLLKLHLYYSLLRVRAKITSQNWRSDLKKNRGLKIYKQTALW